MSAAAILKQVELVTGALPGPDLRVEPDVQVVEETDLGSITRRKVTFAVAPPSSLHPDGERCWAWLLMPKASSSASAMLCLHQTTGIGKDEPAGLGGKPNYHYALELADRGYVTLSPDFPNYGDYRDVDAYATGFASHTMKGVWNHVHACDVLACLPEVDENRIGCIGHSLGGCNALMLAAFEPRIALTISSCGFTAWRWNDDEGRGELGDLRDWTGRNYMPKIASDYGCRAEQMPFDWVDVISAIAPRPVFINAATADFFRIEGVRETIDAIGPRYAAAGVPHHFASVQPDCGHDFPWPSREQAYAFIDRLL